MAGFSKAYWIGSPGGYLGADGMNPISMELLVGDADRQWWEPRYFDSTKHNLGNLRRLIPGGPDNPATLIDAILAFYVQPFVNCESFKEVEAQLDQQTYLDFHLERNLIPKAWSKLRAEALPIFQKLYIFEGHFTKLALEDKIYSPARP